MPLYPRKRLARGPRFDPTLRRLLLACLLSLTMGCTLTPQRVIPPSPLHSLHAALEREPNSPAILLQLAEAHLRDGDYLRAQQYHRVAERVLRVRGAEAADADLRQSAFMLGVRITVRDQQYLEAIQRCTRFLDQQDDPRVRELLALLHEAVGDVAAAERQRRLILSLYPDQPRHLVELARFYERGQTPERRRHARTYYQRYLNVAPDSPDAGSVRAALLAQDVDAEFGKE